MLEAINSLDKDIFLFLNHQHNAVFDFLMYWVSNKWIWIPFYAFLALLLYKAFPDRFFFILVFIALAIALSDQVSSTLIKNWVMRLRPCHDPSILADVHLVNGYCGGTYGFVSSHASSAFTFFSFLYFVLGDKFKKLKWIILGWAILVAYSRIYLGAHFPGDVIGGALLGFMLGFITWKAYTITIEKYFK